MKLKVTGRDAKDVAKRMFWLAWRAAGGPQGMGFLQDRPEATEDDVWHNVETAGDYPMKPDHPRDDDGGEEHYGDYVFGRMLKLEIVVGAGWLAIRDNSPKLDYQSWCLRYSSYLALAQAAAKELGAELEEG